MPIIVDPYLIALPHTGSIGAEHVRQYALRFSTWEKEFAKAASNYVVSWGTYCAIEQDGLMPTSEHLQRLFDFCGIEEYSAYDFVANCNTFLANCRYLEDLPEVSAVHRDVEHLRGSESVIPEEMRQRLTLSVAEAFVTSLIYAACAMNDQSAVDEWFIATAPLSGAMPATDLRTVGMVRRFDYHTSELVDTSIQKDWPLLIEPDYLYASYDVFAHFEDPPTATRIAWCKRKMIDRTTCAIENRSYCFGGHFVASIGSSKMRRRANFQEDVERIFATIVEVLQGLAFGSDKHHALRDPLWSHSAPTIKRKRQLPDGAVVYDTAARVVVAGGNTPLRLHYWRCEGGTYEFSNITTEHDDGAIYK